MRSDSAIGRTVADGHEQAGFAFGDRLGRTAGAAADAGFSREGGFHVYQRARFAARGEAHHVDRVHQVGHIAAEAEEADVLHHAGLFGGLMELLPELAFADDPELRIRQLAEHDRDGIEQDRGSPFLRER